MTSRAANMLMLVLALWGAWAPCAMAKPVLFHRAVEPTPPSESPILAPSPALLVADEGAVNWTPTLVQGESVTYSATSLPTGASINSSTGAITGTLSTPGKWVTAVTAYNDLDENGSLDTGEPFDRIWKPFSVYTSTANISQSSGFPFYGSVANRKYTLTEDIVANGSAIAMTASNVSLDLNGHSITYNDATPITIADASFEQIDDWDFTNAPNATQFAGTFLDNTLYDGTYVVAFNCPTADDEYIETDGTITLLPNTEYILCFMAHFGTNTASTNNPTNPGVIHYAELVGTGGETTVRASKSNDFSRGMQLVRYQFTTGAGTPTYRMRVGVENGSASSSYDAYFDLVSVQQALNFGVMVSPKSFNPSGTPDLTTYGNATNATITNGTILQGANGGVDCPAVYIYDTAGVSVDTISATVSGKDCSCVHGRDSTARTVYVSGSTLTSNCPTISSRDNSYGAVVLGLSGVFANNTLLDGPISGISSGSSTTATTIWRNSFSLKGKYTNNFAMLLTGSAYKVVAHNTIDADSGDYNSRGIFMGVSGECHDNTVSTQGAANNQEYSGVSLGGNYSFQQEVNADATVYDNSFAGVGTAGAAPLRLGPDNSLASVGSLDCTGLTLTVDVTANAAPSTAESQAACIKLQNVDMDIRSVTDSTLTSNSSLLHGSGGCVGQLLISDCTIRYIDEAVDYDYCWSVGYLGRIDAYLLDNAFYDAGTKAWVDEAPSGIGGVDTTDVSVIVANNVEMTLTDGVSPIASTAVVVTDAAATEVFNGSTNGSGVISFVAKDFSRINGTRTEHNPYTISISGYVDEDVTIERVDTPAAGLPITTTTPMTAE